MKRLLIYFCCILLVAAVGCRAKLSSETEPDDTVAKEQTTIAQEPAPVDVPISDTGSNPFEGKLIEVKPQCPPSYGVSFWLPTGWTYSGMQSDDDPTSDLVVSIRPEFPGTEGAITLQHCDGFGVCGTGLVQKDIEFNGHPAWQGFYDGQSLWSHIILKDPKDCVIVNSAANWYEEYEKEIEQILSTVEFVYYGEESGIFAPDVKQSEPGTVSPAYVLDGVADWARSRPGFSKVGRYDMGTLFDTGRAKEYILDYEALMFDDGTVFGYCTFSVPQWIVTTDGEEAACGDGIDLLISLIDAEAGRLGKERYIDGGINRAFFLIADESSMNEFIGFYMNALSGGLPASVTAVTKTIRVVYTEETDIYAGCLNVGLMSRSSERHLPVYKLDTPEDLLVFREWFQSILSIDAEYDGDLSFREATAWYDEEFFSRNAVVLAYVTAGSGSLRFGIRNVSAEGERLRMDVVQTNWPEVCTSDMAAWFVIAEIPDSEISHCTEFDARFVE